MSSFLKLLFLQKFITKRSIENRIKTNSGHCDLNFIQGVLASPLGLSQLCHSWLWSPTSQ